MNVSLYESGNQHHRSGIDALAFVAYLLIKRNDRNDAAAIDLNRMIGENRTADISG